MVLNLFVDRIETSERAKARFVPACLPAAPGTRPGRGVEESRGSMLECIDGCSDRRRTGIIRAEDGIHTTGPTARRGGLAGNPGFPA
jgi:hypothetical protein